MATKYTKWTENLPNAHITFSVAKPSKIYPNCDICFENKPSGNPGVYFKAGVRPAAHSAKFRANFLPSFFSFS
jgi:hypothetical protein